MKYIAITKDYGILAIETDGQEHFEYIHKGQVLRFLKASINKNPGLLHFYRQVEINTYDCFVILFNKATQFVCTSHELQEHQESVKHLAGNTGVRMAFCFDDQAIPGKTLVHQVQFSTMQMDGELKDLDDNLEFVMIHPANDLRLDLLGYCSLAH